MGYSVTFYAVDVPTLKQAFGGRDKALLQALLEGHEEDIAGHNDSYEDEIEEDGWPTMEAMLKQILAGKLKVVEDSEFGYGYALEILCRQLGRQLVVDGWGVSDVRRVPFQTAMMKNGPPIPIPRSDDYQDFPEVGHLTAEEVRAELAALADVPESPDEGVNAEITGFRDALGQAARADLGLVSFRY